MGDFEQPNWSEWSPLIIGQYGLKKVGREYHGPCPNCGGTDRFWITDYQGMVKTHCRQCGDFQTIQKIMSEDGCWPSLQPRNSNNVHYIDPVKDFPTITMDTSKPYHENKKIPLIGASLDQLTVVIDLIDIDGNTVGHQRISPDGQKRFSKGLAVEQGPFSFVGKLDHETTEAFVTEGWADAVTVFTCTQVPTIFGLSANNVPIVADNLRKKFPRLNLTICGDNDDAGMRAIKKARLPYVVPSTPGKDWNDIYAALGKQAVLNELTDVVLPSPNRFKLLYEIRTRSPDWLADGILEAATLAIFFGGSGDGKTFVALDLALSIAFGIDFHRHKVQQGSIAYVAGEGQFGIKRRAAAFCKLRQVELQPKTPFYLSDRSTVLDAETVPELIADLDQAVEYMGPLKLVVLDTLDRTIDGVEDDNSDTKRYLDHCDVIREHFGCTVLVVAHVGHQARHRAKGSTKLRDRMDASYKIAASGDHYINFVPTKMKDAPEPEPITFGKVSVDVETDDGEIVPSLALEKIEMTTPGEKPKPEEIKTIIIREFAANSDFGDMPFADLKRLAAMELNVSQKTIERYVKKLIDAKVFKLDGRSILEGDNYAG